MVSIFIKELKEILWKYNNIDMDNIIIILLIIILLYIKEDVDVTILIVLSDVRSIKVEPIRVFPSYTLTIYSAGGRDIGCLYFDIILLFLYSGSLLFYQL